MKKYLNYVNGSFGESERTLSFINPATKEVLGTIPDSSPAVIDQAVQAAQKAFPLWKKTTLEKRSQILKKVAHQIEKRFDEFVKAETLNTGKPITLSQKVDIPRAIRNLEFYSEAITQFGSESYHHPLTEKQSALSYVLRQPLGVVVTISPWNLPLYLLTWKVAPALATGNCVIAKPSEVTPMTASLFAECFDVVAKEEGLPPGVFQLIHGSGGVSGTALVSHPKVRAVSFTGSTLTGRKITEIASRSFKKVSLEMGGKNPNLIFSNLDETLYRKMIQTTVRSSFSNQGQICLCGSRILVEKSIYEKFKKDFIAEVKLLKQGDPLQSDTGIGSMVSEAHYRKVVSHIEKAKQEGGRILLGGEYSEEKGYFIKPTIIEGLSEECETNQEEIFGPVVSLQTFENLDEAIRLANTTRYGLSASVWNGSMTEGLKLAESIEAGTVWINNWMHRDLRVPFGGMKESGVGREGGVEFLKFFTEPKTVSVTYE